MPFSSPGGSTLQPGPGLDWCPWPRL